MGGVNHPIWNTTAQKKKRKNRWERLEKKLFNTGTIVVYSIRLGNWHQMTQVDSTRAWMYYIQLTIDPCTTIAPFLSLFIYMPVNHPSYYPIAFTLLGELMAIKSTSSSCRQWDTKNEKSKDQNHNDFFDISCHQGMWKVFFLLSMPNMLLYTSAVPRTTRRDPVTSPVWGT
jgi:hypothetical protein